MDNQLIHCLWLGACFLTLFSTGEILYHKFGVRAEYTRKLIHLGTGILTLLFPVFLRSHWFVLLLCGMFALILLVSLKYNLLKSINAIDRKSHGSISYPAAVYGTFLFYDFFSGEHPQKAYFYIPVLTLAVCDPIAALCGKRWPWKPFQVGTGKKTMMGSLMFFLSATLLSAVLLATLSHTSGVNLVVLSLLLGLFGAFTEAMSRNGFDNLLIPLTAIVVLAAAFHLGWYTPAVAETLQTTAT
ncbi:MAG: phosphatidate cytidylyltransferase [Bacteroidia bacterium]|jgi:dolichol kinase|nr:phosphatidate cytidylyltransferase [Bacteroidia bacterium]